MWQQIEEAVSGYCLAVLTVLFQLIETAPPLVSIGVPLLVTAAGQWFLPSWASMSLAVLVWIPAALGFTIFLISCWPHVRRHRTYK